MSNPREMRWSPSDDGCSKCSSKLFWVRPYNYFFLRINWQRHNYVEVYFLNIDGVLLPQTHDVGVIDINNIVK